MDDTRFKEWFLARFNFVLLYIWVGFGPEMFSLEAKEYNKNLLNVHLNGQLDSLYLWLNLDNKENLSYLFMFSEFC